MQGNRSPIAHRFDVFTQLPNKKGFRIKGSKYIYMFDKYGGWYDQYNNYYSPDGQPQEPPSDEEQQFQRTVLEDEIGHDDEDDQYQRQYGGTLNGHEDDESEEENVRPNTHHQKTLQAISLNLANLHQYPLRTPCRVDFLNMNFKVTQQQILKNYRQKIGKGVLNVVLTKEQGKFTGEGYFVCDEVCTAEKLVKCEGQQFMGRKVFFQVQQVQEFLIDPVTKDEMDLPINEDDFKPLIKVQKKVQQPKKQVKDTKKKYLMKEQENKQPIKVQQAKPEPKKQEKKQSTWAKYQGDFTMFPKKDTFKEWMTQLGFKLNEHFREPVKISKDDKKRIAAVELVSEAYQKVQGSLYENIKIHLEKVD